MSSAPIRKASRFTVLLAAGALVAAGCGGSLSDEEVLAASGVAADVAGVGGAGPGSATGTGTGAGTGTRPGAAGATTATTTGAGGGVTAPGGGGGTDPAAAGAGEVPAPGEAATVGTPGETGPIIIGSVGNYSGPAGTAQAGIPRGVQIWAAAVNANGGLFGRQAQVIVVDDGGDPARYASAVQDLVENRGVVAFVGNGASLSMDGGIEYLNSHGIPVFGSDCSRFEWHQYPVFFPQCMEFGGIIRSLPHASIAVSGLTRFGFVVCTEAAACTSQKRPMEEAVVEAGGTMAYEADISLTQIDFTAECRNAQRAGVELMFVAADGNTLLRFARSCERQQFFPQYLGGGISVNEDVIQQRGLEDIIVPSPVFPFQGGSGGAVDEYNAAMEQFGDGSPGPAESFGWAAAKEFELIATRAAAAAQSISPETLIAAAHTVQGETLGGLTAPLDFTGERPATPNCYYVMQGGDGGWMLPMGPEMQCLP